MERIIEELQSILISNSGEKTRISGERFFREEVKMHGLKSSLVESIARDYFKKLPDRTKGYVFGLCEELWKTGYMEESFIACNWSYSMKEEYMPEDFHQFERWVKKYLTNWASCDTLCNHTIGTFIEMYPSFLAELTKWANSENRWVKRASAVTLIIPARRGKFLNEIIGIADILHSDPDDMVQKGYGWMLKAASQAHQNEVFEYVIKKKGTMPRTALRYAIEKMPPNLKAKAMAR